MLAETSLRATFAWLLLTICCPVVLSNDLNSPLRPELISVFPLGGRQGTSFQITVEGENLEGAYAAWFHCDDVQAAIREVESLTDSGRLDSPGKNYSGEEAKGPTHRVRLDVKVDPQAERGLHGMRLVTPRGMSNGVSVQVVAEPVTFERSQARVPVREAQQIPVPVVVNGRLENLGELDLYSFEAEGGEELLFQVFPKFSGGGSYQAKVEQALYEGGGSWFDPDRLTRINPGGPVLSWEPVPGAQRWFRRRDSSAEFVLFPRLRHRFEKPGRYYLSASAFLGASQERSFYQLRIISTSGFPGQRNDRFAQPAHSHPGDWLERDSSNLRQWNSFLLPLRAHRLGELLSRSAASVQEKQPADLIDSKHEIEPNDSPPQALAIEIPAVVEGAILSPGDVDQFSFRVQQGRELAVEIETPATAPPIFNPWLKVLDDQGQVVFSNVFREYGGDGDDVNKNLERKTLYRFDRAGIYYLQIRDLTSREHGSDFQYRVLVRPQIPHLGRVEINLPVTPANSESVEQTDHINLPAGEAREIIVVCEKEENLQDDVVLEMENLPPGVEVTPSTPANWTATLMRSAQFQPVDARPMDPKNYRSQREPLTLILYARPEASPGRLPRSVRLQARLVKEGKVGDSILVGTFPLMVVAPSSEHRN